MESGFIDQEIKCIDCAAGFTWTAGEQRFWQARGWIDPPKRCQNCRRVKRERFGTQASLEDSESKRYIVDVKPAR